jgi:hypothetical protein
MERLPKLDGWISVSTTTRADGDLTAGEAAAQSTSF